MITYEASGFYMIRTPLLPIDKYLHTFQDPTKLDILIKESFNSPELKESLAVSSNELMKAIDKNNIDADTKSSKQILSSLIKYYIRLSTRPTPFGLFSGISIGQFGDSTDIRVADLSRHTKRARPDMEWVYGFIKELESNSEIRNSLHVRFNDFTYVSGNRIDKPNKTFLQLNKTNETTNEISTSIRYTNQVKIMEEQCTNFQLYSNVMSYIASQNPNVPISKVESFLSQLLENEYLLSELRPPLINTDMLEHLIFTLDNISEREIIAEYINTLKEIQNQISIYNSTPIGKGMEIYNEIIRLQKKLYKCKNYLQVDMKTHFEANTFDSCMKRDLEAFAMAMYRLAPDDKISDEMSHYADLFLEKYGYNAEVPVIELLDMDRGLGSPSHFNTNVIRRPIPQRQKPEKEQRLKALMERKVILSLREGKKVVKLCDEDIEYVCENEQPFETDKPMNCLQSFEMYLLAHPSADYKFTLAPNPVSDGFGKTYGRFSDMLSNEESLLLKQGFDENKKLLNEYLITEISELPSSGRTSNVATNDSGYDYQIALTTNTCEGKQVINIRDVYIGVEQTTNRFYIKSKSLNRKLLITMTSMLTPLFGSAVLRFLREISVMRRKRIIDGLFSIHSLNYEYCPRITYGRVIIKPETWTISKNILGMRNEKDKNNEIIESKFNLYRQKWDLPQYIFLNEADNRLLLDLDLDIHRNELYHVLKKDVAVTLTELGCNFEDYVSVNANGNRFVTEIVVPFILKVDNRKRNEKSNDKEIEIPKTLSNVSENQMKIKRDQLLLLPGNSDWMYYKLYGCNNRQNELISTLYEVCEELVSDGLSKKYFFIRYSDPEPHLRVRIQPSENNVLELYAVMSKLSNNLHADGLISKAVNDTYMRELERYGGLQLIQHAEKYFHSDSKLAMSLITMQRYNKLNFNMDYIGISFIVSVLEAFNLSFEETEIFLNSFTNKKSYKKDYQNDKRMIMSAVDSSDDWFGIRNLMPDPKVYDLINENSTNLRSYVDAIYASDQQGELTNTIKGICTSIIHMFFNRLIGSNAWEERIYCLTRHGVNALHGYLKHNKRQSLMLELPENLL